MHRVVPDVGRAARSQLYDSVVARYDYRCTICDEAFEVRRSMTDDSPVTCSQGHAEVRKLLTMFASVGAATGGDPMPAGGGGGCCGGACGCG